MNGFDKELYVTTVATATVIINYANDVAIVWDRYLQDYPGVVHFRTWRERDIVQVQIWYQWKACMRLPISD